MISLWASLVLAAAANSTCPTADAIAQHLPSGAVMPTDVSIVDGRLSMTVVFLDGQKKTRQGIRVSSDCDERARTVAAVARAWQLAWRPVKPKKSERPAPRRSRRATLIAKETSSSSTAATATKVVPVEPAAAVATTTVADSDIQTESTTVAAARRLPVVPGAVPKPVAKVSTDVFGPVRVVQRVSPVSERWSAPRWVALGLGLSAVGTAVALNATQTQEPTDVLPLGLYFVGGGVSIAALLAD